MRKKGEKNERGRKIGPKKGGRAENGTKRRE
jgi:hypothetical protein